MSAVVEGVSPCQTATRSGQDRSTLSAAVRALLPKGNPVDRARWYSKRMVAVPRGGAHPPYPAGPSGVRREGATVPLPAGLLEGPELEAELEGPEAELEAEAALPVSRLLGVGRLRLFLLLEAINEALDAAGLRGRGLRRHTVDVIRALGPWPPSSQCCSPPPPAR